MLDFDYDWEDEEDALHRMVEESEMMFEGGLMKWAEDENVHIPIAYKKDWGERILTIYTNKPGFIIGKGGQTIRSLEKYLNEEYPSKVLDRWKVILEEIQGEFVTL